MRRLSSISIVRTALSILLTGVIVLVLVLTAPESAEAVTVTLTPSPTLVGVGGNVTFDVTVAIDANERIPIQDAYLRVFSDEQCATELTSSPYDSPHTMSLYSATPDTGYGIGDLYGNDTREGQEYYFGYGYGYGGNVTLVYRCVVYTGGWSAGTYYSRGDVDCGTHTFQSGVRSFTLTSVVAETTIEPIETLNDKFIVIPVTVTRIKDAVTGETVTGIAIANYQVRALYDPAGVYMVGVTGGDPPFDNPVYSIDNEQGLITFGQDAGTGLEPPLTLALVAPRLVGCANDTYLIEVSFDYVEDPYGTQIPHDMPKYIISQRGDINGDGNITEDDITIGDQYLSGQLTINEIKPINMASVHHDMPMGDRCKKQDTQDIDKFLKGRLDCYFE